MIDLHLHCDFSMDSTESIQNVIDKSLELGMETIAFTDHIDLYSFPSKSAFSFNVEEYFETLERYRDKYKKDLEILIGVEIGLQPDMCKTNDELISNYPFDFIIGSIHTVKHMDIFLDKYLEKFSPKEALKYYYEEMLYSVENTKNFNILGHVDYIDRYFKDRSLIPAHEDFSPVIEKILIEVINSNRGIELNTAGIRKGLPYMNPKNEILEKYKELGGEIITIGSDAHFAKDIGASYNDAVNILKGIGFKHLTKYVNKEPIKVNF